MKYIKVFGQHSEYEAAKSGLALPNVSHCVSENDVHYNPIPPMNIIRYNASSKLNETTSSIDLGKLHINAFSGTSGQLTVISHTFENGIGTIEFDDDIITIGDYAFYNCTGLTNVEIPSSVTNIGDGAFNECTGLTSIVIPDNVTTIGLSTFSNCYSLTNLMIPNSVITIGQGGFASCTGLTSVEFGSGVTSIGIAAFQSCNSLTSVTIPNNVINIGQAMFYNCTGLTSVEIGNGVTSIGGQAFQGCINLSIITSHIMSAPSVNSGTFASVKANGTLYVPQGSSGYETWMNNQGNLGTYNWTKVEQ